VSAGIGVLTNDGPAWIHALYKGADGIEWRRAWNVNRDGPGSIRELQKSMTLTTCIDVSSHNFLPRSDVPDGSRNTVRHIVGLKDPVLQDVSVRPVKANYGTAVRGHAAVHGVGEGFLGSANSPPPAAMLRSPNRVQAAENMEAIVSKSW